MAPLGFYLLVLVLVLLLFVGETSSHLGSSPYISSVNIPPSMVMGQHVPIETTVAPHLHVAVTMNFSQGAHKFHTTVQRSTDTPRETLTSKGYNFPLKFRENKFVPLGNGMKATFDCLVEPPFIGNSKPWIEVGTGYMYCLLFPYSKDMKPLEESSFALLFGRLSLSRTGKMMNITSEYVIICILENSDVEIHWGEKEYLSLSFGQDIRVAKSRVEEISLKDQITTTLSAGPVKMIIGYEVDKSEIPRPEYLDTVIYKIIVASNVIFLVVTQLIWLAYLAKKKQIEDKINPTVKLI